MDVQTQIQILKNSAAKSYMADMKAIFEIEKAFNNNCVTSGMEVSLNNLTSVNVEFMENLAQLLQSEEFNNICLK